MTKTKPRPDFSFERKYHAHELRSVGVDEVGRGCLAGPVVTAAVMLPLEWLTHERLTGVSSKTLEKPWWQELNDSKLISPKNRERLAALIMEHATVQIAWCSPEEIDRWNILHAAMTAMRRALEPFSGKAQAVLVDGHLNPFDPKFRAPVGEATRLGFAHVEMLVKGDQRSLSIAAASIVAKVYRDRWMRELCQRYPDYGFAEHKGYSTPVHYAAIEKLGACDLHRVSFEPFKSRGYRREGELVLRANVQKESVSGSGTCNGVLGGEQTLLFKS